MHNSHALAIESKQFIALKQFLILLEKDRHARNGEDLGNLITNADRELAQRRDGFPKRCCMLKGITQAINGYGFLNALQYHLCQPRHCTQLPQTNAGENKIENLGLTQETVE